MRNKPHKEKPDTRRVLLRLLGYSPNQISYIYEMHKYYIKNNCDYDYIQECIDEPGLVDFIIK